MSNKSNISISSSNVAVHQQFLFSRPLRCTTGEQAAAATEKAKDTVKEKVKEAVVSTA